MINFSQSSDFQRQTDTSVTEDRVTQNELLRTHTPKRAVRYTSMVALSIFLIGAISLGLHALDTKKEIRSKATNTGPTIHIAQPPGLLAIGQTISLGITLNTQDDTVSAATIALSYDASAIRVNGFTNGTILPVVLKPAVIHDGVIIISVGVHPDSPFKGAGILGTLSLTPLSQKQTSLQFDDDTIVASIGKSTNALTSKSGSVLTITSADGTLTPEAPPLATNAGKVKNQTNTPSPTTAFGVKPSPEPVTPETDPAMLLRMPQEYPEETQASINFQTNDSPRNPSDITAPPQPTTFLEKILQAITSLFR